MGDLFAQEFEVRGVWCAVGMRMVFDGGEEFVTVDAQFPDLLAVLSTAERRTQTPAGIPAEAVSAAILSARVPLSAEQQPAVRQLAISRFGLLTAPAGSGKGEVLRAVAQAHKANGKRAIALAAAGETAQRFGKEVGADLSLTVDGFTRGSGVDTQSCGYSQDIRS